MLVCLASRADIDSAFGELKKRAAARAPEVVAAQAAVDEKHAAGRGASG